MGHGKVYMMPKLFLEFVNESLEELVKEATNYCKVHKIIGEKYNINKVIHADCI